MFNFLTKKVSPSTSVIPGSDPESRTIKLSSIDCPSCAVDIDLTLEELPGVVSSKTNYAKSETNISFDPQKINLKEIKQKLLDLGYLK